MNYCCAVDYEKIINFCKQNTNKILSISTRLHCIVFYTCSLPGYHCVNCGITVSPEKVSIILAVPLVQGRWNDCSWNDCS